MAGLSWQPKITTANTALDGTGTVTTLIQAGASGGVVRSLRLKATGANPPTLMRLFLNNNSTNSVPANNQLLDEIELPASSLSDNVRMPQLTIPLGIALQANHKLNATLSVAAGGGWAPLVDYADN